MIIINPFVFLILISGLASLFTHRSISLLMPFFYIALAAIFIPFIQLSDNVAYENFFENSLDTPYENSQFDIGYHLLNQFISIFFSYEIFRALFFCFILGVKSYILFNTTKLVLLAFVFYFAFQFYVDAYLLRASFSAAFVALALFARFKGQNILGFFLLMTAVSFHLSALAVFPLWVLVNLKMTRQTHIIIFFSLLMISQFPLAKLTLEMFSVVFQNSLVMDQIFSYVGSTHGQPAGILRGSVIMYSLIHLSFLFLVEHNKTYFSKLNNFVLNCMLFAIIFLIGFNDMVVICDRISRFTIFFYIIGLTIIIKNLEKNSAILAYYIILFFSVLTGLILDKGSYQIINVI